MRGEFVEVGDVRLYYYAAGTRGGGPPVVLLHGFPLSSRLWRRVVRDFPPGHRLVVCDLPGYGRSDLGHADPSCETHGRIIIGLLDRLHIDRACLVGHGLGGGVAQRIAVDAPERISHLALIDSAAWGASPRMACVARAFAPVSGYTPPGLLASLIHGSMRRGFVTPEPGRLLLDACLHPFASGAGRTQLVRHLRALGRCDTATVSPRLAALDIPTAILWGIDDPFYPLILGERLRDTIPHASFHPVAGASHFLPVDASTRVVGGIAELLRR